MINGEALHLTGLYLKWFRVTIFHSRSHPSLFCNFWQLSVKVATAHHPIIQKEVDELLAKGVIEPPSGGAGFYSSMFVVPKHVLVASGPYLTLSILFVLCIYLPMRCQLLDMYSSSPSMVIMLSPLIYRMLICIFLLLSIIIISCDLFGIMCLISGRSYLLAWLQPLGFSQPSLNLFCSFAIAKVSVYLSIWMTSWSWFTPSGQVRGFACFCVPYWSAWIMY